MPRYPRRSALSAIRSSASACHDCPERRASANLARAKPSAAPEPERDDPRRNFFRSRLGRLRSRLRTLLPPISCVAQRNDVPFRAPGNGGWDDYSIFSPVPSIASFYWSEIEFQWIDQALADAVPRYLELGSLPDFDVLLATNLDAPGEALTLDNDNGCVIVIYTQAQYRTEAQFKQLDRAAACSLLRRLDVLCPGP